MLANAPAMEPSSKVSGYCTRLVLMPKVNKRSILSGMTVSEVMRRQLVQLPAEEPLCKAVNHLIKYKCSGLLVTDRQERPRGVVSKTDLMSAYYGGLPIETPLADIMSGPILYCAPSDGLEAALHVMGQNGVHRLYVKDADSEKVIGIIAYTDIVAQLYRFCRVCTRGNRHLDGRAQDRQPGRATVREVMTNGVLTFGMQDRLAMVIEGLSAHVLGAVLIKDQQGRPAGVISKTDLILAFNHGIRLDESAQGIMTTPVCSCSRDDLLIDALHNMLLNDVQRLFVHFPTPDQVIGVLGLSDAARYRSGTCQACTPSRFISP